MKFTSLIAIIFSTYCYSQSSTLNFAYDAAGNQQLREICITCNPTGRVISDSDPVTENFLQSSEFPEILYYPNPVQEKLYIKWNTDGDLKVNSIEVYSLQGQLIESLQQLSDTDNTTVTFLDYAQGIYNVLMLYNNGEKKVLKVIKK